MRITFPEFSDIHIVAFIYDTGRYWIRYWFFSMSAKVIFHYIYYTYISKFQIIFIKIFEQLIFTMKWKLFNFFASKNILNYDVSKYELWKCKKNRSLPVYFSTIQRWREWLGKTPLPSNLISSVSLGEHIYPFIKFSTGPFRGRSKICTLRALGETRKKTQNIAFFEFTPISLRHYGIVTLNRAFLCLFHNKNESIL